jgi:3-hexulose-6-phosphate synthase/6-phospho-3-hexuloisomerase
MQTLNQSDYALQQRLRALRPALLSDALGKSGAMSHDMRCWSANPRMVGPAFTLRIHTADILMVGLALADCPPQHVLVIDGRGELNTALWGGITTLCARLKGIAGVVIDGAIRDVGEISRDTLPVFARAAVPNAGGAEYSGEIGATIQCANAVVSPGDWIVGDEDGVVVVPAGRVQGVAEIAERLQDVEKRISAQVERGRDLAELLRYREVLDSKARSPLPQMRFEVD